MTFALKGEVLNFKAIVSKFYLFCMFASLLSAPSTAVLPSFISIQLLFFEVMFVQTHVHIITFAQFLPSVSLIFLL